MQRINEIEYLNNVDLTGINQHAIKWDGTYYATDSNY